MFHLFAGSAFYPEGGMADYTGSYSTIDEAKSNIISELPYKHDWAHVATFIDGRMLIVAEWGERERDKHISEEMRPDQWREIIHV